MFPRHGKLFGVLKSSTCSESTISPDVSREKSQAFDTDWVIEHVMSALRGSVEIFRIPTESADPDALTYLDSAIPRFCAKGRKNGKGWRMVSCCRLAGLAVKMNEAAHYEILSSSAAAATESSALNRTSLHSLYYIYRY